MIRVLDLKLWAEANATGKSISYPEGWISGIELKMLADEVLQEEPLPLMKIPTARDKLVEDWQGIDAVLCELEDAVVEHKLTELQVVRALARSLWHILSWIIRRIDNERRDSNG